MTCVADFHCVTNAWRRRKAHLTRGYSLMKECLVIANYHWGSKAEIAVYVCEREKERKGKYSRSEKRDRSNLNIFCSS